MADSKYGRSSELRASGGGRGRGDMSNASSSNHRPTSGGSGGTDRIAPSSEVKIGRRRNHRQAHDVTTALQEGMTIHLVGTPFHEETLAPHEEIPVLQDDTLVLHAGTLVHHPDETLVHLDESLRGPSETIPLGLATSVLRHSIVEVHRVKGIRRAPHHVQRSNL
ncbi:hypothetical protein H257_03175 [Aphanomyces astaci]|uniref:Uncharacterized protein n=1 Tax=Aphanomyces astaci TaxID=112090 RepID=W4H1H6_APHAT|nr:hypothetical protein H257_03175 [Aphanomyces astaci]ETV85436.1 hypothetical protein H257_03175 [Aphanomyces astaci]|eukprot:XP_009825454.1 hypothetical protein H257_03175 [Aphanomyces astaci]